SLPRNFPSVVRIRRVSLTLPDTAVVSTTVVKPPCMASCLNTVVEVVGTAASMVSWILPALDTFSPKYCPHPDVMRDQSQCQVTEQSSRTEMAPAMTMVRDLRGEPS